MNKFETRQSIKEREENVLKENCPDISAEFLDEIFSEKPYIKEGLEALKKYPDGDVTFKHSLKTADLTYLVAEEKYSQDPEKIKLLVEAAFSHDFGKLKVDSRIINYPGKIENENDLKKLTGHVEGSFKHLKKIGDLELAKIVLLHHRSQIKNPYPSDERMAELLNGETITEDEEEMGNILAMVDFFEALSASRPYKEAKPPELTEKFMRQDFGNNVNEDVLRILKTNHQRLYSK